MVLGKKNIYCRNETITIESSFLTRTKKKIHLSKNGYLLLRCEKNGRFIRNDIFQSHVSISVDPTYYAIKTETDQEILKFSEKKFALEAFNYICQNFPNIEKKIDFFAEKNILKEYKLLWSMVLKNFLLFIAIATCFISLILFFFSYCIHSDAFEKSWEQCSVYIERECANSTYVWVLVPKQTKRLKCRVLNSDLQTLREVAKRKEKIKAYITFNDSPELRLSSPNKSDFILFISVAGGMLFTSIALFFLFFRIRKKLLLEFSLINKENSSHLLIEIVNDRNN